MDGVTSFPSTNGKYRIDDSIPVTDWCAHGIPIYRQVGGNGYPWHGEGLWYHTTVACDASSWQTTQFYTRYSTTANSPDLYTGGDWYMDNSDHLSSVITSSITITSCGECCNWLKD